MSVDLESLVADVQREHEKNHSVSRGAISDREAEVLRLLCEGKGAKEIARELGISPRTVDNHRWHINRKTGCYGTQLGVWAVRNGIV